MHRHRGTHAHTEKASEEEEGREREINSRQHRCISINPPVYSFTLFVLVLEPDCQTLFPHKWRVLADISQLMKWQQTYGFIRRVWILGPILSRKTANANKFCLLNYTAQLLEGDEVCLLSQSHVGERDAFEEFEWDPAQHLWAPETKREIYVSRSVLLGFNNYLIFFSGAQNRGLGAS